MKSSINSFPTLKKIKYFYIGFIIFSLVLHSAYAIINIFGIVTGKYSQEELDISDFQTIDLEIINNKTIITSTDDSQLIFSGDVRNIVIECNFSQNIGEFVSFYNKSNDNKFTQNKMIHAKIIDGKYIFEYPLGTKQVRIDTGIFPSVKVSFQQMTLNKPIASTIWGSFTSQIFYCLVCPPILFLVYDTFLCFSKKKN